MTLFGTRPSTHSEPKSTLNEWVDPRSYLINPFTGLSYDHEKEGEITVGLKNIEKLNATIEIPKILILPEKLIKEIDNCVTDHEIDKNLPIIDKINGISSGVIIGIIVGYFLLKVLK